MKSANKTLKLLFTAMFLIAFTLGTATAEMLTMPTDLQVIGEEAFFDDTSIERVVLPSGIIRIEARAFARSGLKRINLPATLEYIAPDAFDGCSDFVCTGTADSYASRYCEKLDIPFVPYPEPVSQISLNASQITLEVGDSYKIVVAYLPSNASHQYAYFSVDNNCVSIDDAGVITAQSQGSALVTVTAADGSRKTATISVTVNEPPMISVASSGSGNTRTISVTANKDWSAKSDADWISLSQTNGSSGTSSITATLAANPSTTASRSGTVTFTCGTKTATVTITQAAADSVSISPTAQAGGNPDGGGINPTITANGAWTAVSDSSWLTLSQTSGSSGSTKVNMTYAKNTSTTSRTATVTVTCGTAKATYKLTQNAHTITASVSGSGNTRTISVSGNGSWTAKADVTWITLNKTSGSSGTSSVTATLAANPSTTASRSGTVTFTCGAKTATVTITQDKSSVAVTGVSLNKSTAALKIGGTVTLTATVAPSNATNKNVTWSSSNTAVATVSNGTVTGKAAGTATITVKTADSSKTATCTVTVYGKPAISFTSYPTSVTTATTGVDIVAKVTGGKGPYTGYWTMYKGGTRENGTNTYAISTNTTNWPINQFGSAGSFQAELTITDALGQTVSAKTGAMTVTVPDTITATASGSGNTRTISVTANGSWTVKSNATWITLNRTSGSSGTSSVTATLAPNPSATASRSGTVTFTRGTKTTTVTITQAKPVAITAGPAVYATRSGSTVTFSWDAIANAEWYDIEIYTADNWQLMIKENGSVTRYTKKVTGLTGTSYQITLADGNYVAQVAASNAASWAFGKPENAARVSIGNVPVTTGPVMTASVSGNTVTLNWSHVSNALWYDIEFYTVDGWNQMLSEGGSVTRYIKKASSLTGLSYSTTLDDGSYVIQIAARNDVSWKFCMNNQAVRMTVGNDSVTSYGYDRSKAIAYANKYYSTYNPDYSSYKGQGGDCANFASQCVHAGGIPWEKGVWQPDTNDPKYNTSHTSSWTYVPDLINFFKNKPYTTYYTNPTWSNISEGDLLIWSDRSHVTVVVEVGSNYLVYCGHTNDERVKITTLNNRYVMHFND